MVRAFIGVVLAALLLTGGFVVGRFLAPPATFEPRPAATSAEADLDAAWSDYQRAQQRALDLVRASEFYGSEQERAEAYRGLLYSIVGGIRAAALLSIDHPRFTAAIDWSSKSGLDNPDNNYFMAYVRDDREYRVTGTRGTTVDLTFQTIKGRPGVKGAGAGKAIAKLSAREMRIAEDGRFEVLVSRSDPGAEHNWLRTEEGTETIIVRYSHSDWAREEPGRLAISEIGAEGAPRPALTAAEMARGLRDAAASIHDRTAVWLSYANRAWTLMPRNGVSAVRPTADGLIGQYSAFGSFDLAEDQALIITTHLSDAVYQGIELGNLWFVSLDYETRVSTLTADQAHRASDGKLHFVVSRNDPGVPNWLDPGGHARGLVMLRWQGLDGPFPEDERPTALLVRLDELRSHLPADTPSFDAGARREQRYERWRQAQRRFPG